MWQIPGPLKSANNQHIHKSAKFQQGWGLAGWAKGVSFLNTNQVICGSPKETAVRRTPPEVSWKKPLWSTGVLEQKL